MDTLPEIFEQFDGYYFISIACGCVIPNRRPINRSIRPRNGGGGEESLQK
jgi:hypothetical protein